MNKNIRHKAIALIIAFFSVLVLGCGANPSGKKPDGDPVSAGAHLTAAKSGAPDYSAHEGERMPIGAWNPSDGTNHKYTEEELLPAKEAGIQFLCDFRLAKYTSRSTLQKNLDLLEKTGLKAYINLSGLSYADVHDADLPYSAIEPYIEKDFFLGFNFWDEPGTRYFDRLAADTATFAAEYPAKKGYVNLLPNYATNGQLGMGNDGTYKGYVDEFAEKVTAVSHLSYDFYPLLGQTDNGFVMNNALNGLWLSSLEAMSGAAKRTGKDLWVFIQCMDFNNHNRAPQSVADITFQNYVNMCYGARGLQYFSYTTPPNGRETFGDAMLDRNYAKTQNFAYVKAANEELQTFAHAYMQFTWDNAMPVEGTVITDLASNGFDLLTTAMTQSDDFEVSSNMDALVGQFHDANGYKGYMVARMSDPMDGLTSTMRMTFNADRVLVYHGGKSEVVSIPDGVYNFNMEAGEGRFVIPFNA